MQVHWPSRSPTDPPPHPISRLLSQLCHTAPQGIYGFNKPLSVCLFQTHLTSRMRVLTPRGCQSGYGNVSATELNLRIKFYSEKEAPVPSICLSCLQDGSNSYLTAWSSCSFTATKDVAAGECQTMVHLEAMQGKLSWWEYLELKHNIQCYSPYEVSGLLWRNNCIFNIHVYINIKVVYSTSFKSSKTPTGQWFRLCHAILAALTRPGSVDE